MALSPEECAKWVEGGVGEPGTWRNVRRETAAHLRRLVALDDENEKLACQADAIVMQARERIAALERDNARLRAVIADLLETDASWTAAADWNAALGRAREALEPPVEGVPGQEGSE